MKSNYLFELGTEELPPKALQSFSDSLQQNIESMLTDAGLDFDSLHAYNSPRRLALLIEGLSETTPRTQSKIWGPPANVAFRDGVATKAALGFCQRNNIDIADAKVESDGKVEKLCCLVEQGGNATETLLPTFLESALAKLPIPKRMRWAAQRTEFVRPVRWLVLMKDAEVIQANILGLSSSNVSSGHRFLSKGDIVIAHASEYLSTLESEGKVIVCPNKRKALILEQVEKAAAEHSGKAVVDSELLDEVTALVEWPIALLGKFDERFLTVPSEALISSMKEHQKYFHVVNDNEELLPYFITVSNIEASDYSAIISGNEKVIRPRLDDAAFFFETDKKTTLASRREKLKTVVFQAQLGSIFDKTERIKHIAKFICDKLNMDSQSVTRTAELCKSDLVSNMVYEFSDMQGIAGYHYAVNDGEDSQVATAISEHYLPKFAGDSLPSNDAGSIVAIADRIDTLVGIFGIGQSPTGSKDPFALRRASVSILRLIIENNYDLDLKELLSFSASQHKDLPEKDSVVDTALQYVLDRFKAWYEEANVNSEVYSSVANKNLSHPLDIHRRVMAVAEFLKSDDAKALAAANKRVANILSKQDAALSGEINADILKEDAERELAHAVQSKMKVVQPLFKSRDYSTGLSQLADLRSSVDAFFDNVMVMDENLELRENRLLLLQQLQQLFLEVADISVLANTNS